MAGFLFLLMAILATGAPRVATHRPHAPRVPAAPADPAPAAALRPP